MRASYARDLSSDYMTSANDISYFKLFYLSSSVFLFSVKSERALNKFDLSYHFYLYWVYWAHIRQRIRFPFWGIKEDPSQVK